jgi:hypothetical protein
MPFDEFSGASAPANHTVGSYAADQAVRINKLQADPAYPALAGLQRSSPASWDARLCRPARDHVSTLLGEVHAISQYANLCQVVSKRDFQRPKVQRQVLQARTTEQRGEQGAERVQQGCVFYDQDAAERCTILLLTNVFCSKGEFHALAHTIAASVSVLVHAAAFADSSKRELALQALETPAVATMRLYQSD